MEYIEKNPCVRVRRIKAETKRIEAFTVEEQRAIEAEIARSDDKRLHGIVFMLSCEEMPKSAIRIAFLLFVPKPAVVAHCRSQCFGAIFWNAPPNDKRAEYNVCSNTFP